MFTHTEKKSKLDYINIFIYSNTFPNKGLRYINQSKNYLCILKNTFDRVFSFISLIFLIPIFIVVGLLIFLTSKGPIFFKQKRVGLDGKIFYMVKFRTMINNAEEKKKDLIKENEANGPVFKIKKDPRITAVGFFLRKTGLDELPQFWNVLKGDMSLIGPRPPLEEEVKKYKKWQLRRLSVKPGITCTWQIHPERHKIKFDDWVKMDLDYIDNWNPKKDIYLFVKTFQTFFYAKGH